ncbi:hypothetical protein A0J61_11558, partial [Choanephora cucurbitarum]
MHLHLRLLAAILEPIADVTPVDAQPFRTLCYQLEFWYDLSNRSFRASLEDVLLQRLVPADPPLHWRLFWSLPLRPECPSMWYRIIYDKFHCHESTAHFMPEISPSCSFCNASVENRRHLLVECPVKWELWSLILRTQFPYMDFQPSHIVSALW